LEKNWARAGYWSKRQRSVRNCDLSTGRWGCGLSTLWTSVVAFPLMAAIQQMCARIELVTSQGLTGTLKKRYPRPILYIMLVFSFPAIVTNIGADIAGMGAVGNLLFPSLNASFFSVFLRFYY